MVIKPQAVHQALRHIDPGWTLQRILPLSRRAFLLQVNGSELETSQLVLLSHSETDRERNPDIARDEHRLLAALEGAGLPVARPLYLEQYHEPPFLVTSYIAASPRFSADNLLAFCKVQATALSRIHAIDLRHLAFLPQLADIVANYLKPPADDRIRSALRRALQGISLNPTALLHGDFWLGNLLWNGNQLSGIIDWEDAMLGDPLADLGKSRLEILWALGEEAMNAYTSYYLEQNVKLDSSALPFWDLWGAARLPHFATFATDAGKVAVMQEQYDRFVEGAIRALDAQQE